ncbi:MAG: hypothetical protein DMD66_00730 [Gemmatimonadetes bacterium]|nr:MAG: hypothetical protein DMD66_00730 [Gemmatimonadota bacterium]
MTAEELLVTNVPNKRTELVRGRLIVHEPPGGRHGCRTTIDGAKCWPKSEIGSMPVRVVWVIDPERRLARVYRADGAEQHLDETHQLLGEDVLPGFSCSLASILG